MQFHIFKNNVKNCENFDKRIKISLIFSELDDILIKFDTIDDLKVVVYGKTEILIAPSRPHENYTTFQKVKLDNEKSITIQENEELKIVELKEPRKKRKIEAPHRYEEFQTETKKLKRHLEPAECVPASPVKTTDEIKQNLEDTNAQNPRWNTNSSLSEDQKNWIWESARKSEVKENGKSFWKCSVCLSKMSSFWVLRKHLRDVHIIKQTKKSTEKRRGKDFMIEVRNCKLTREVDGKQETYWQCSRCENINKSESGFIKHLLYQHINNATVDPTFIAKCKIEIEHDDKSKPPEVGWNCPECKKFFRSAVGLKNHLKLSHKNVDFGGEKYLQKIQETAERSMIIKEEEKLSEIILETEKGTKMIWECKRCDHQRYFRSESGFKTHMRICHLTNRKIDDEKIAKCRLTSETGTKLKLWKCSICGLTTKTKEGFVSHVSHLHPGQFDDDQESSEKLEKTVQKFAKFSQNDEFVLQNLAAQVVNDRGGALKADGYKFSCNDCGLFFSKHYKTHIEAHKTIKQIAHHYKLPNCQECRVIYNSDNAMMKHLEWHVEGSEILPAYPATGVAYFGGKEFKPPTGTADDAVDDSTWKCGHCFAMFWNELEVVEHIMLLHIESLECPVDHLEFGGNRGLGVFCLHMKNKHPELFPNLKYPCTYCKTEFTTVFDKLSHMKVCSEKKLVCDGCGKRFFDKVKLAHHIRIEKRILQYSCSLCGKDNFKNSMDLKLHVLGRHTATRNFSCTFCDKTFKNSAARSSHMETHSEANLKCVFCSAMFKKRIVLARHMKTIHDEVYRNECFKEFSCKLCSKSFLTNGVLKNHLQNVHKIIEEEI